MSEFLIFVFLFSMGSISGWTLEVLFRRFFSAKKWINPGFLTGPCLPLYGFSLCMLYALAMLEKYIPFDGIAEKTLLFILMAISITFVEYIAGLIFIKALKIKLWDYSGEWGNIKGIICPKFTFFWYLLSALYYFCIHPHILDALRWLANNLAFSFVIGFFYGIFVIDLSYSTGIIAKIRKFAAENDIVMKYEELREQIRTFKEENEEKARFLLSMNSSVPLSKHLKDYLEEQKKRIKAGEDLLHEHH